MSEHAVDHAADKGYGYHPLHRRYERNAEHLRGFAGSTAILICYLCSSDLR
ncbi:hypothetical protein [Streptomyces sp. GbtcB6]|uniref:hypothetical protein n=1 Tax=Streptomyces sp. GbtcB6 TaxID=2824751 RepID=UPI001C2F5A26|nr:hypothetical protein [Streptomyces sp. GbtcB6]